MTSVRPSVSVVILTYRRVEELLATLATVAAQEWPGLDVVVVNNEEDDAGNLAAARFPAVRVVEMGGNVGTAARNDGVAAALGEIVITIDNDVHLVGADFIHRVAAFFAGKPGAGCVVFSVLTPEGELSGRDWCHPRRAGVWSERDFETTHISEGACAFRREAFLAAGGYDREFFIGHEGPDLWARLFKAGVETWYCPSLKVLHFASPAARPGWRAFYYNTRNNVLLAHAHWPFLPMVGYLSTYTTMMLYYALREGGLVPFARGLRDGMTMAKRRPRAPFDRSQMARLRELWRHKPGLVSKIAKHLRLGKGYR